MQSSPDFGSTFSRAWQLLTENWIIIVPGIVIAICAGIIIAALAMVGAGAAIGFGSVGLGRAGVGSAMISGLIIAIVSVLATILNVAYTTGMAGAAWRTGRATLDDGMAAFRKDAGAIFVAILLLFALGILAAFVSFFTFGLALVAYAIFFLYTFASVIVGGRSGTEGVAESARMAWQNFVMTLIIVILLGICFMVAAWIGVLLHVIPFIGQIVSYLIQEIVAVYAALVVVGEYVKLELRRACGAAADGVENRGVRPFFGGRGARPERLFTCAC